MGLPVVIPQPLPPKEWAHNPVWPVVVLHGPEVIGSKDGHVTQVQPMKERDWAAGSWERLHLCFCLWAHDRKGP